MTAEKYDALVYAYGIDPEPAPALHVKLRKLTRKEASFITGKLQVIHRNRVLQRGAEA